MPTDATHTILGLLAGVKVWAQYLADNDQLLTQSLILSLPLSRLTPDGDKSVMSVSQPVQLTH